MRIRATNRLGTTRGAFALLVVAGIVIVSCLVVMCQPERAWSAGSGGSANISAKTGVGGVTEGLFVTLSSDGVIATASSPADAVVGVCRKTAVVNQITSYAPVGAQTTVTSGEAITAGDLLTAGLGGQAFVLNPADIITQRIAAVALTAAIAANHEIDCIVVAAVQQGLVPALSLTGTPATDGTGSMSLRVTDAAGTGINRRFRVRCWLSTSAYGAPAAQTDFSVALGTQLREITANADYEVITDQFGMIEMDIDTVANGSYYVMAEVDGRISYAEIAIEGN